MKALTKFIAVSLGVCSLSLATLMPKLARAEGIDEATFARLLSQCATNAENSGVPAEVVEELCRCLTDGTITLADNNPETLAKLEEMSDQEPETWSEDLKTMFSTCVAEHMPVQETESETPQ
jgi:predicted transcriptional regulator